MLQKDAAKILDVSGTLNPEAIKKAYRKASSKYHPDKGGSVQMMQAVNEAYEALKDFDGSLEAGDNGAGYSESLNEAINKVLVLSGVEVEVCGAWVWVTGDTKPHAKALGRKEGGAGFYFAKKKSAWYFRPDDWKSSARGQWSLDDIRDQYGSTKLEGKTQKKICRAA
ncbi:MAG: J domain-containing protein [Cellvibrionaceae bacterium]